MAHTVKISDGSTEVDFLGSNYKVLAGGAGWAPRVARRNPSDLGEPYLPVREQMAVQVKGTSTSDCLSKLQTLTELLDQATSWGKGGGAAATAVYMEYEPPNSGLANSVKAVIWDAEIILPRDFEFVIDGGRYVVGTNEDPILVSFTRRGLWLGATETETSSASTGNPAILTSSSFTDTAAIPWPYNLELDITAASQGMSASNAFLLFQNAATKLYSAEAEGLTLVNASSTGVAAASAGNVARCDSSAAQTCTISDTSPGFASGVRKIAMFTVCKNLSADTVDWEVYGQVSTTGASHTGRSTIIPNGDNDIKVVNLGIFSLPADIDTVAVGAANTGTGTASSHGLDVDYICAVAIDDSTRVVNITTSNEGASSEIHIDHRLDSELNPLVYQTTSGGGTINDYPPHVGDAVLAASGNVIACLGFGVKSDGQTWTLRDSAGEVNLTLNVTRAAGYLNPL